MQRNRVALGEQERQERHTLLALGAERAQVTSIERNGELVAMRAVSGEAPLHVLAHALSELGSQLFGLRGGGAGPVGNRQFAVQPQRRSDPCVPLCNRVECMTTIAHERDAVARELHIPTR